MDASSFVTASIKKPVEFLITKSRGQSPSHCISVTDGTGDLMQAKTPQLSHSPQLPLSPGSRQHSSYTESRAEAFFKATTTTTSLMIKVQK